MLELRLLDPTRDLECYQKAYNWRNPKKHTQPDRMPFETFASDDPLHISVGLFNGELLAVYFLCEFEPSRYEAHFTSQRGVSKQALLNGAKKVIKAMFDHGATQIVAGIRPRNKALRDFLIALHFQSEGVVTLPKNKSEDSDTVLPFEKFVLYGTTP